jgi:hypothetical protein
MHFRPARRSTSQHNREYDDLIADFLRKDSLGHLLILHLPGHDEAAGRTQHSNHKDIEGHRWAITQGATNGRMIPGPPRQLAQLAFFHAISADPD